MKLHRSTKCTLKHATQEKRNQIKLILTEYQRVCNQYINLFWENPVERREVIKPIVTQVSDSWFSYRLLSTCAYEALDMISASKEKAKELNEPEIKPTNNGKRMCFYSTIADLQPSKQSTFDAWLHLQSIGNKMNLDIPIKFHKHFHKLSEQGRRLNSYIITPNYIQFCFEIKTEPKLIPTKIQDFIGIDTGINALASLSTGVQLGTDIKAHIERIKRCKHGSNGQLKASRALRQYIDEIAKKCVQSVSLVVVENLKNITKNTKLKRRLSKNMRRSIGRWNVSYWLRRLQFACELNRVSFRRVPSYYTSQTCSSCGHINRGNRNGAMFKCLECGHTNNADINAAINILTRFLTGSYGISYKHLLKESTI